MWLSLHRSCHASILVRTPGTSFLSRLCSVPPLTQALTPLPYLLIRDVTLPRPTCRRRSSQGFSCRKQIAKSECMAGMRMWQMVQEHAAVYILRSFMQSALSCTLQHCVPCHMFKPARADLLHATAANLNAFWNTLAFSMFA